MMIIILGPIHPGHCGGVGDGVFLAWISDLVADRGLPNERLLCTFHLPGPLHHLQYPVCVQDLAFSKFNKVQVSTSLYLSNN